MVKKTNNIDKNKYQKKSYNMFIFVGLAIALVLGGAIFLGGEKAVEAWAGPAPAGDNCPENVAYIQQGVNLFNEMKDQFPTDVNQLLEVVDGKPVVERIPPCPGGNLYVIDNGVVKEVPAR